MADDTTFTPGAGANLATDDIGGVHYPRSKVNWGPDGTSYDADEARPLPVAERRGLDANYGAASIDDTATGIQIVAANTTAKGQTGARVWVVIYNNGSNPMAIGSDTSVTFASGLIVQPMGQTPPLPSTNQWRGICDTSKSTDARYLEIVE